MSRESVKPRRYSVELCRDSLELRHDTVATVCGISESDSRDGLTRPRHTFTDSLLASGRCGDAGRVFQEAGRAFVGASGDVAEEGWVMRAGAWVFGLGG